MNNDEILIILEPEDSRSPDRQIVLKVDSRISYKRLLDGINHYLGITNEQVEWKFINTIETGIDPDKIDPGKSLYELGFVTGTVMNRSGKGEKWFFESGKLNSQLINKRFDTTDAKSRNTLKYNVSNRVVTNMEETVIEILSPGKIPEPARSSILDTVIPTLISIGSLWGFRMLFIPNGTSNYMLIYMGGSVLSTFSIQLYRFFRNKSNLKKSRNTWKNNYENYLDRICRRIEFYQRQDVEYLNDCYPPMKDRINSIDNVSGSLFSRSVNDFDFMDLRFGNCEQVKSLFTIHHTVKDEIELGVTFHDENGHIKIDLPKKGEVQKNRYLNELSEYLALERYHFLKKIKKNNEEIYPPLVVDFKNCGAMGCVAFLESQSNLLDHIILELASEHKPQDLQFVFFSKPESDPCKQAERIRNYRCLPHFNELFGDISQFVFDDSSAGMVFSKLEGIMNERSMERQDDEDEENRSTDDLQQIICIFEYDYKLKEKAFSKYLPVPPKTGEAYINKNGLTFIFAVDYKELLPQYCGIILERHSGKKNSYGTVQFRNQIKHRNRSFDVQHFEDEYIFSNDNEIKEKYHKAFSQLSSFYSLHIQERGSVPERVNLFDLYPDMKKMLDTTDDNAEKIDIIKHYIESEWNNKDNNVTKTLSVPIGMGESKIVDLDLHEAKDGPHMLVAGTTGSGKSETMLTYLIGLCIRFSPQYLNLILVDMKGNSFAGRLKALPHCVATVDNVSSEKGGVSPIYMLKRFLELLKSEIKRREIIFEEYGVDKLDNYISIEQKITSFLNGKKDSENNLNGFSEIQKEKINELSSYNKKSKTKKYPPVLGHLVFVVDEFTELKRFASETDTDYIGELTSIARVGRTLGLHMILVSQNIENAITDDIRVNTRSRVCLKVATRGASKEMLDGRTDAFCDMPNGRGYFLVGSGSTYEYFQSGYASENMEIISEPKTEIVQMNCCGAHSRFYNSYEDNKVLAEEVNSLKKDNTQLNAVIEAVNRLRAENADEHIYRLPAQVFQQPLDTMLRYSDYYKGNKS